MSRPLKRWYIGFGLLFTCLVIVFIAKGIVIVKSGELGILHTFSKAGKSPIEPGLQFVIPFVNDVKIIRLAELKKQVILQDARKVQTTLKLPAVRRNQADSGIRYFLTADENLVTVDASIQYRIKDSIPYLYRANQPDELLRALAEHALIMELIGTKVDDVLSRGRALLLKRLCERLQQSASDLGLGIVVTSFLIGDVVPPSAAIPAFMQVSDARAESEQIQSKAQANANEKLAQARGEARKINASASSYQSLEMARARGEAERFDRFLSEYKKDPKLTRKRLSLDAQQRVLPTVKKLYFDSRKGSPKIRLQP